MANVLSKCAKETSSQKRYYLKVCPCKWSRTILRVSKTVSKVDVTTAVTHALIYACWVSDLELVKWILDDLQELIDINMQLGGHSIIDWTSDVMHWMDRQYLKDAADICRLLIRCYGPKLDINNSNLLRNCWINSYADIIAHLVMTYTSNLVIEWGADDVFGCLVRGREWEAAMIYLTHHNNRISDHIIHTFTPAARFLNAEQFISVLDVFESDVIATSADRIIHVLCSMDAVPECSLKTKAVFDRCSAGMDPNLIESCLADCWNKISKQKSEECKEDQLTGQLIIEKHIVRSLINGSV